MKEYKRRNPYKSKTHIGNYDAALKAYEQAAAIHPFMDGYDDIVSALKKLVKGTAL